MKFIAASLCVLSLASPVRADPLLTPLVASAISAAGLPATIAGTTISTAALATSVIYAGAPVHPSLVKVRRP